MSISGPRTETDLHQKRSNRKSEPNSSQPFPFQNTILRIDQPQGSSEQNCDNEITQNTGRQERPYSETQLREFIFQNGRYFDSYLATEPGRLHFWSRGYQGLISYQRWRNHVIIGGGLIAPEHHKPQLVDEFLEFSKKNKLSIAFHNIGEHDLSLFQERQFQITKWGEDPIIDLESCTWKGKKYEWVRRQTNYCLRQGVTACEVRPEQINPLQWSEILSEVTEVADESLTRKPQSKALKFFEGQIDNHELGLRRLFIARKNGRIEGFVVCNPIFNGTGWATELYRHRLDSVKGTMAFLIHYVLQQLKAEGVSRAGLCLDLGRDCHALPGDSILVRRGLWFAEKYLTGVFDFSGLRHFKSRFRPEYKQRFACVYPKATIGSIVAFSSITGAHRINLGKLAKITYSRIKKRSLRKNLTAGKVTSEPKAKSKQSTSKSRLSRSA